MNSAEFASRLLGRAALAGLAPDDKTVTALETYLGLLAKWNHKINLTALQLDPVSDEALDRLLIEPLAAARQIEAGGRWLDLGSGGGSPAIPMQLALSSSDLVMVERRERKASFLREAIRALGLSGTTVVAEDVEVVCAGLTPATVNLVTVRALKLTDTMLEAIVRALELKGKLVSFRSASGHDRGAIAGFSVVADVHLNTSGLPIIRILQRSTWNIDRR